MTLRWLFLTAHQVLKFRLFNPYKAFILFSLSSDYHLSTEYPWSSENNAPLIGACMCVCLCEREQSIDTFLMSQD